MFWTEGRQTASSSTPSPHPPKCPEQKKNIKNVEDSQYE